MHIILLGSPGSGKGTQAQFITEKYSIHNLVYYEETNEVNSAIEREKQIKKWNRKWKLELIEKENPNWNDLSLSFRA